MSWLGGCYTSDTAIVVQPGGSLTIEAVIYASMAWISTHPAIDTGCIAPGGAFYYTSPGFLDWLIHFANLCDSILDLFCMKVWPP